MVSIAGALSSLFIVCHPQRLKICRRVFTIFGTVLLMRAVSVSVTVLPDASPACRQRFEVRLGRKEGLGGRGGAGDGDVATGRGLLIFSES